MAGSYVVADASLAAKWVFTESFSDEARRLLRRWRRGGVERLVPALFTLELGSALLSGVRRGDITQQAVPRLHAQVLRAVDIVPDDHVLAGRAIEITQVLGLWKPYDSLYAALAEREGCDLWTGDERFFNAAKGQFAWVRWVGNA